MYFALVNMYNERHVESKAKATQREGEERVRRYCSMMNAVALQQTIRTKKKKKT